MINRPELVQRKAKTNERGFTLVELLVVIGIIALLISILLPSLNRARKAAITLKCASALREIGHAYEMYASDNKGWWPPAKLGPLAGANYSISNVTYVNNGFSGNTTTTYVGNTPAVTVDFPCYWYNFISKYLTRYNIGTGDAAGQNEGLAQQSLLWGCPEWGYQNGSMGYTHDANDQLGYGVNNYPTMTSSHPASTSLGTSFPDSSVPSTGNYYESTIISSWSMGSHGIAIAGGDFSGSFYQMKDYNHPSEHALVADSIFWITTSYYIAKGDTPTCAPVLATANNTQTPPAAEGQTWADFYRHGDYPRVVTNGGGRGVAATTGYDPGGGKVGYNILFCDGHVITSHSKSDAFLYFRMRYPG